MLKCEGEERFLTIGHQRSVAMNKWKLLDICGDLDLFSCHKIVIFPFFLIIYTPSIS
jgi:hypothetical protein